MQIQLILGNGDVDNITTDIILYITPAKSLLTDKTALFLHMLHGAGPKLLEEINQTQKDVQEKVKITKAYNLPAKYIIYGIPQIPETHTQEQVNYLLEEMYDAIFEKLNTLPNINSISVEFLWSRSFSVGIREHLFVQAIKKYNLSHIHTINIICPTAKNGESWQKVLQDDDFASINTVVLVHRPCAIDTKWYNILELSSFSLQDKLPITNPNEYNIVFTERFIKEIWERKTNTLNNKYKKKECV